MAKSGGMTLKNPLNEVANDSPDSPDLSGGGLYGSFEEVIAAQCSQVDASFASTPNSNSGDIMGTPCPSEPSVVPAVGVGKGRS